MLSSKGSNKSGSSQYTFETSAVCVTQKCISLSESLELIATAAEHSNAAIRKMVSFQPLTPCQISDHISAHTPSFDPAAASSSEQLEEKDTAI